MQVKQMSAESFERKVIRGNGAALVEFQADWCVHCRRLAPVLRQIAAQYEGRLTVGQVDVEAENQLALTQEIEVLPTLKLYRAGKSVGTMIAPDSKDRIDAFIREKLGDLE